MRKKYLLAILILSALSCGKKNNDAPNTPSIEVGQYKGAIVVTLYDIPVTTFKTLGGEYETAYISHKSGGVYKIIPDNENLPSFNVELKKIDGGYGIFIPDGQTSKYGNLIGAPMTQLSVAYSGTYDQSTHSLNCGYFSGYLPVPGSSIMGGILLESPSGSAKGAIQINITKR